MSFFDTHKHSLFRNIDSNYTDVVDFSNPIDLLTIKLKYGTKNQSGGSVYPITLEEHTKAVKRDNEFVKSCKNTRFNQSVMTKSCYQIAGFNIDM